MSNQIVIGAHSIYHALKNRKCEKILFTDEGKKEFRKLYPAILKDVEYEVLEKHQFQETSKKIFAENNFEFQRIPSGIVGIFEMISLLNPVDLYQQIENQRETKILLLDGVTDVHNAAAIIRTAAFFGIDGIVISGKQSFGMSPGFFRIASGGAEYVKIFQVSNLSRVVLKIQELGLPTFALSEHESPLVRDEISPERFALILGQEDRGISHAVMRACEKRVSLHPKGKIQSLNVSIAAAVALKEFMS